MSLNAATVASIRAFEAQEGYNKDSLLNVMLFETAGTLSPSIRNPVSGATGLIQFMKPTALALGTTQEALAKMTVEDQLIYVRRYFHYNGYHQKILASNDPLDIYLAVLYPALIGKPDTGIMAVKGSKTYTQNAGLDRDKNGQITKGDIRSYFFKNVASIRSQNDLSPLSNAMKELKGKSGYLGAALLVGLSLWAYTKL